MNEFIVPFNKQTPEGASSIRRGLKVPPDAVNLSWVKSPRINPKDNVIIIDTSQITPENVTTTSSGVYYADDLGILQDSNGNQLFGEAFPYITDQLSIKGDLTNVDLSDEVVFPFVHVSRFFHIDAVGLTLGSGLTDYVSNIIKVVDVHGRQYLDENGKPLYRIQICPAINLNIALNQTHTTQIPYRVFAYIDTNVNDNLFLTYNKVEISNTGALIHQEINYTETLNLKPVYDFRPEPAEVVDLANRDQKWYSSRNADYQKQILGKNITGNNGYNIFVPKKAINDPRLFQPFRWRVTCQFSQNFAVDKNQKVLNVGVIVTNNDPTSIAAQTFNALMQDTINLNDILFVNPLATTTDTTQNEYWYVNIDNLDDNFTQQLDQFDILLWVPTADYFDFSVYMGQINYFTKILGKTLIIDTENGTVPVNLGITATDGVAPLTGVSFHGGIVQKAYTGPAIEINVSAGFNVATLLGPHASTAFSAAVAWPYGAPASGQTSYFTGTFYNTTNADINLFDATALGGWLIDKTIPISNLQTNYGVNGGFTQYITNLPTNSIYHALISLDNTKTINSGSVPTATWSFNTNTSSFSYAQSAIQTVPLVGTNTLQVTVPTVPTGWTYLKTEVFQSTVFSGADGSAMATYLTGGDPIAGFSGLEHLATIESGGTATIFAGDFSTDVTLPGSTITTEVVSVLDGIPANTVTYQSLRAVTYYYKPAVAVTNVPVAPHTNFNFPVFTGAPVIAQAGNLFFSTFDLLSSAASGLEGAAQLLYNTCLYATRNKPLTIDNSQYASSYTVSSPWSLSWVINTTSNSDVLTVAEKTQYNFYFLPEDLATPQYVWQRQLSAKTLRELINESMTPAMLANTANAERTYTIDITNSSVEVPGLLGDTDLPFAWTWAYTPTLEIPVDYSTYIIKEKVIPATYEAGQYISRSYPYVPYAFHVTAVYDGTLTLANDYTVNWDAVCTATLTYDVTKYVPPKTIETPKTSITYKAETQEVALSWARNSKAGNWISTVHPYAGGTVPTPYGLFLWTQANYYNTSFGPGQENYVYNGLTGRYQEGSTGSPVQFLQDVLNKVTNAGLVVDGYYGSSTVGAVRNFQILRAARYIDGVVDAETWSLIGGSVISHGLKNVGQPWGQFYDYCYRTMQLQSISDSNNSTVFGKRSWVTGGPSQTWEIFSMFLGANNIFNVHGVTFVPYVEGSSNTMLFEAVHTAVVSDPYATLINFDSENMMIKHMNRYVTDNQATTINFSERQANYIMVGVGQNRTSFPSTSRFFGVRDITALATVTTDVKNTTTTLVKTNIPGYYETTKHTKNVTLTSKGKTVVTSGTPVTIQCHPNFTGKGTLSHIRWVSASSDNPNVGASISSHGKLTLTNNSFTSELGITTIEGPQTDTSTSLGGQQWFSKNSSGILNPWPEVGTISKTEGLVLFCNQDGTPYGFPSIPPAQTVAQRQLTNFRVASTGTDSHVIMGFYDTNSNEFITDINGNPVISYNDYIIRGPHNIFVAAINTYELNISQALPTFSNVGQTVTNSDDAPYVPNMLLMPVYGVFTNTNNRIGLAQLPNNLGLDNIWPIAIKPGKFTKRFNIPQNSNQYQFQGGPNPLLAPGAAVTAFYEVDISKSNTAFSCLFGPPNIDVIGETPTVVDTNVIQVAQTPILLHKFPTNMNSDADPVIPIFTVYQRADSHSSWVPLDWSQIADYNIVTGEITLQNINWVNDPNLWKVNYTSAYPYYLLKFTDIIDLTQPQLLHQIVPINLNPIQTNSQYVNQTLYVYAAPVLILNENNEQVVIQHPYQFPISFTTNPDLFNPNSTIYDPALVLIGLIRIANNFDISDLVMVDSRIRGGGIPNDISFFQAINTIEEAKNYWDINYGTGMSYQNSGFVLIRLPSELKGVYPDTMIKEIIDKNIGAGIVYKLEDLDGNDWNLI